MRRSMWCRSWNTSKIFLIVVLLDKIESVSRHCERSVAIYYCGNRRKSFIHQLRKNFRGNENKDCRLLRNDGEGCLL